MKINIKPVSLTEGAPLPVLARYTLPMLTGMFFQQAYNLADSWIAGNQISSAALGAVGTCYPITVFYIAIASGLSMGTSIFCSQNFGAQKFSQVKDGIRTALWCFLPFSILLMLLSLPCVSAILRWLAVPEDAMELSGKYLAIYLSGIPFLFLYNISTGILNGLGDSKTPLFFLILSSLVNIVLDFLLVMAVPFGISGLAFATMFSQAAAAFATLFAVYRICLRLPAQDEPAKKKPISRTALREILGLGIPSVIQHVFMSAGQLVLQNVINRYGLIVMTGYSVSFRINGLIVNSVMALSNALSGYTAQNKGAEKYDRIHSGFRISLTAAYVFSAASVLLLFSCGPSILFLFVGSDPQKNAIIEAGMGFIHIVSPFYLLVCLKIICDGALRGMGAMTLFTLSTVTDVLIRIFFGNIFSSLWGINGVWWIWPFAWFVGTTVSAAGYMLKRPRR